MNGEAGHNLIIYYDNTNPVALKSPPQYWGGAYVNYLRVGLPISATITSLSVGSTKYPVPQANATDTKDAIEDLRNITSQNDLSHPRVEIDRKDSFGVQFVGFFVLVDSL